MAETQRKEEQELVARRPRLDAGNGQAGSRQVPGRRRRTEWE